MRPTAASTPSPPPRGRPRPRHRHARSRARSDRRARRHKAKRHHHRRPTGRPAMAVGPIARIEGAQIHLRDGVEHRPNKVILRHPLAQPRRHQKHLLAATANEVHRHDRSPPTRPDSTPFPTATHNSSTGEGVDRVLAHSCCSGKRASAALHLRERVRSARRRAFAGGWVGRSAAVGAPSAEPLTAPFGASIGLWGQSDLVIRREIVADPGEEQRAVVDVVPRGLLPGRRGDDDRDIPLR
jgi:hypothetical protein